jgi:hypothetical protein
MARQIAPGFRTPIHTSLPASPVDGQEIRYLADAANGVIWTLRYRAGSSSAYKWEFVGGSPLIASLAAGSPAFSSTSWAYVGSAPSIAIPLAGDYLIGWQNMMVHVNGGSAGAYETTFGMAQGGTPTLVTNQGRFRAYDAEAYAGHSFSAMWRCNGVAVGNCTLAAIVAANSPAAGFIFGYYQAQFHARPVRVG